jgi:hypothetical protein
MLLAKLEVDRTAAWMEDSSTQCAAVNTILLPTSVPEQPPMVVPCDPCHVEKILTFVLAGNEMDPC